MRFSFLLFSLYANSLSIQDQNRPAAIAANNAKSSNVVGKSCTSSGVICVGDALGQCVNGKIVSLSACAPSTKCFTLPLVNKIGTSVTCDTDADASLRLGTSNTPVSGSLTSRSPVKTKTKTKTGKKSKKPKRDEPATLLKRAVASNVATPVIPAGHQANDFVCIDDTSFMQFTGPTTFVVNQCPKGLCFTRTPPSKNPCIGKGLANKVDGTG